jgi:ubiquinone/menaquinone biosynthesis C-methylase UbiE
MVKKFFSMSARFWMRSAEHQLLGLFPTIYKYKPYQKGSTTYVVTKPSPGELLTCSEGLAIPPEEFWLGYSKTPEFYIDSGKQDVETMQNIAKASGFSFNPGQKILDFGCGAGRMIRQFKNLADSCEIWGLDVDSDMVYWCKKYLEPPFHFAVTTSIPHLPFPDRYFNFIYAGSLFTHIDDLTDTWLLELRRVLAPEGRLYITIHDNHTMKLIDSGTRDTFFLTQKLKNSALYQQNKDNLTMLTIGRDPNSLVFYDRDFFCQKMSVMYDVLSVTEEAYSYQTAVLAKPRF